MQAYERTNLLKELEERLLPLRLALLLSRPGGERKGKRQSGWTQGGWIREMRQAIGMPVDDLARRMGVKRREVNRMVRAEGLGCELVYGLVPKEGTVKELAAEQTLAQEIAAEERQRKLQKAKQPFLEAIGWEETWMQALRASMRRDGYRVREAKTDRNVKNQIEEFGMKLKMLEMAGALGPFVKKYLEGRDAREREGAADKAG
jgi:transcriptional regulator with XRE-family HTH domain